MFGNTLDNAFSNTTNNILKESRTMEKITNIIFNPQDLDDTRESIATANTILNNGEKVTLEPFANLVHVACLALLTNGGFKYSPSTNKFTK